MEAIAALNVLLETAVVAQKSGALSLQEAAIVYEASEVVRGIGQNLIEKEGFTPLEEESVEEEVIKDKPSKKK